MPQIPETIGPYHVLRPIAQGGMAEVFEVRDPDNGERRAVKLLQELQTSVKRFNREFEAMTRLNHPNIVRVYRYGYEGEHPWMSMELLRGVPLQVRVKEHGTPGSDRRTQEVIRIGYFVANALQYIHDRGLIHRDLKSANVQVLRDGRVKLLDFGTAHLVNPLERITQEGDFIGTFSYAAPEQIVGREIDHRADLYALGILLYRLLTGRRPFKATDPHKVAHMHLHVLPTPIRELVPALPQELEDLVSKLLQKARADRPQRADEVARELERIAGHTLSLEGLGIAVHDDISVGRGPEVMEMWKTLELRQPGHLIAVVGGDSPERARFLDEIASDGAKREILTVRTGVDGSGASLAKALAAMIPGDDNEAQYLRDMLQGIEGIAEAERLGSLLAVLPTALARLAASDTWAALLVDDIHRWPTEMVVPLERILKAATEAGANLQMVVSAERPRTGVLASLRKVASGGTGIRLTPLDDRHTALAIANLLHRRPPPPDAARRIRAATGGHPTLIHAVVRGMVESGKLQVSDTDGNRVEWGTESDRGALPPAVLAHLEQNWGDLPLSWRRVLEVIDVVGGRGSVTQVGRALALHEDDVSILLRAMVDEDLVRWKGTARHAIVPLDPLLTRWAGTTMRPHRRAAVQHVVADLVEREPPHPAQVRLLLDIGRSEAALARALTCGRDLLSEGEVEEALWLLETVLPTADLPELPADARIDFHLLFAEAVQRVRPMDARAVRSLQTADRLAQGNARTAEVRYAQAEQQRAIGHYANHRKYLVEAWDAIPGAHATSLRARVALELAHSLVYGAQLGQAQAWFDSALEAATAAADRDAADRARIGIAEIHLSQGMATEAEALLDEVIGGRTADGDPVVGWFAVAAWGHTLRRQGRFSEALPVLLGAVGEARDGQSIPAWAAVTMSTVAVELDLYRLGRAQELIEELASALGPGERLHIRLETRLYQGRLQIASGQPTAANFLLEEVVDQAEKAGLALLAELGRAYLAEARWALGAHDEAKALYQKGMLGLMSTGDLCSLADAIVSRARVVGATEDPTKAFRLVRRLLARQTYQPLYIEHLLAETRWFEAQGEEALVKQSVREVHQVMNRLAAKQTRIEQATLRVHPWAHELNRALPSG